MIIRLIFENTYWFCTYFFSLNHMCFGSKLFSGLAQKCKYEHTLLHICIRATRNFITHRNKLGMRNVVVNYSYISKVKLVRAVQRIRSYYWRISYSIIPHNIISLYAHLQVCYYFFIVITDLMKHYILGRKDFTQIKIILF